jgi:DNA-binding GntR family transcriptional regulator
MPSSTDVSSHSLGKIAYAKLRSAIETGTFKPGDRVSVNALADLLKISRTPTREAIAWLETDGLIVHDGSRGRVVAHLDHQMVNELYAIRSVLEAQGAALAAQNASAAEIEVLKDMLEAERAVLADPVRRERYNRRFHEAIYQSAHNRYLIRTLTALQTPMLLLGAATASDSSRVEAAFNEHVELVAAIVAREPERAGAVITRHLATGQRIRIKAMLQALDSGS